MSGSIDDRSDAAVSPSRAVAGSPSRSSRGRWRPLRRAGDIARDRQRWRTAARCYQWYLSLNPSDTPIWVQLGHVLKEAGRPAAAADAYARALRLDSSDPDLLADYGRLCLLLGQVDDVVPLDQHSTTLDGSSRANESTTQSPADRAQNAQLAAGDAARERREWRLAAEHYRAYLRLDPSALAIWVRFGQMLQESQQYAEAARAFDTAQRLGPDDAGLLLSLAELSKLTRGRS